MISETQLYVTDLVEPFSAGDWLNHLASDCIRVILPVATAFTVDFNPGDDANLNFILYGLTETQASYLLGELACIAGRGGGEVGMTFNAGGDADNINADLSSAADADTLDMPKRMRRQFLDTVHGFAPSDGDLTRGESLPAWLRQPFVDVYPGNDRDGIGREPEASDA